MFIRVFLLSILLYSTTIQAQNYGPGKGWSACEEYPGYSMRHRGHGMGHHYWHGDRHRRGGGFRGSRMGGRCGGHSWWDIPVQEARKLNPIEVSPQSLERGETLYRANCTRCHGVYGFGDGPQAKELRVSPANLHHAARHYSDGELFYIIRKGRDPMPAWENVLTEEEMWNLINYLRFQIGARHRGLRFGYYPEQDQSPEVLSDKQTEQMQHTQHAHPDHQAMDPGDMHEENCNLNQAESHDEHQHE